MLHTARMVIITIYSSEKHIQTSHFILVNACSAGQKHEDTSFPSISMSMSVISGKSNNSFLPSSKFCRYKVTLEYIDSEPKFQSYTTVRWVLLGSKIFLLPQSAREWIIPISYPSSTLTHDTSLRRIPMPYSESTQRSFRSLFSVAMPWEAMVSRVLCSSGATARVPLHLLLWDWPLLSSTRSKLCRAAGRSYQTSALKTSLKTVQCFNKPLLFHKLFVGSFCVCVFVFRLCFFLHFDTIETGFSLSHPSHYWMMPEILVSINIHYKITCINIL